MGNENKCNDKEFCKGFRVISNGVDFGDKTPVGIWEVCLMGTDFEMKEIIPILIYKSGNKKKKVMLNFCPVCGESFKNRLQKKEEKNGK